MARPYLFIGSTLEGPEEGRITLRGQIDAVAAVLLNDHLVSFLESRTRFITVDATEVVHCDPRVVQRSATRNGASPHAAG